MTALVDAIKKVATGPQLGKNLTEREAFAAMQEILTGEVHPVRAAVFFIAMRMKHETNEENLGILKAMQAAVSQLTVKADELLIFADPFNGFNRYCPVSVFLPAVLAAAGLPTLTQGVLEMGPKFGVTHAQVLKLAGYQYDQSLHKAEQALSNPNISWAYLDQSQACPALFALQELRTLMIKRPSMATLEKMLMPIKGNRKTHLAIGFVHKEYPPILSWLATEFGYDSAWIARGLEGGIVPTLREPSNNHRLVNGQLQECRLDPDAFSIEQDTRGVMAENVTAQQTLEQGLAALAGQPGPAFDSLLYGAATLLWHTGLCRDQQQAAERVRQVILSGKAKAFFDAGIVD